jgi:tetratricopeptide (TPR) repeat protein
MISLKHSHWLSAVSSATAAALALTVVGCATTTQQVVKDDPAAAKASAAFLNSVTLVPASEKLSIKATCSVPNEAQKPAGALAAGPSKDWRMLVAHANVCVKEKNWKTLETLAYSIARIDVDSPWGAYFLSVSAEGTGDLHRGIWMAGLAQKKAGGRSGLFAYQKGRILFRMKDTANAMKEIEQAVALDPKLTEGYLFLADVYRRDLETDKAAKSYAAALEAEPANYKALTALGEIKLEQNQHIEAADYYSRAVGSHPEQLEAWLRLAFIYETVEKNGNQALTTYKSLRSSIDSRVVNGRPDFDLNAKINALEQTLAPRAPAQAKAEATTPATKSVK